MKRLLLFILFVAQLQAQIMLGPNNKQVRGVLPIVNGGTALSAVCSNLQTLVSNGTIYVCTTIITDTTALAGDVTGTIGATIVGNDSHAHTTTTLSGIDISADTNLAVTSPVVLTDDTVSISSAVTLDNEWDTIAEIETAISYDFSSASNLDTGTVPAARVGAGHIDALTELDGAICGTNELLEDQGASWACIATPSGGAVNAFSTIGNAVADSGSDTLTVTDSSTIDFTTTNGPEDLTGIVIANSISATQIDETSGYSWSGAHSFAVDIGVTDGVGDTPDIKFTPQTGTVWDLLVEDTGDDFQIRTDTASTETLDIVNIGVGVAELNVEGSITGPNVTSGANPGHTHTTTAISGLDVSSDTNLAVTSPIVLTDDTISLDQTNLEQETHAAEHQNGGADEIATATPGANAIPKAEADGDFNAGWIGQDQDYDWTGENTFTQFWDKGSEVRNVKAYGAVGDGSTDDTTAIQAAIDALHARGGTVFLPAGAYKITSTLTIGDGTSGGESTKNGIKFVGAGNGPTANESSIGYFTTNILWGGAAAGTMLEVNGPIADVHIENLGFTANSANRANTCLDISHAFHSKFRNIVCDDFGTVGIDLSAYSNPTGVAIGANNNLWENVRIRTAVNSATGIRIGASDSGSSPFLDVAGNSFTNLHIFLNGTTPTGIHLRYTDNLIFMGGGITATGGDAILVTVPASSTTFPHSISFYNIGFIDDATVSGSWTGTAPILFWPFNDDFSANLPTSSIFAGITTTGVMFGSPFSNFKHKDSANAASAGTLTLANGNVFHITGTTTITTLNTCNALNNGRVIYLIFDGILTFTDGSNLKLAGDFVTTADDTINLACDGTNWYELSRSVN